MRTASSISLYGFHLNMLVACSLFALVEVHGSSQTCKSYPPEASPSEVKAAIDKAESPFIVRMRDNFGKDLLKKPWAILPDSAVVPVGISPHQTFYTVVPDPKSPIGFRRQRQIAVDMPWSLAKKLLAFRVQRHKDPHAELPQSLRGLTITLPADKHPFGEERIPLDKLFVRNDYAYYANGHEAPELQQVMTTGVLKRVIGRLLTFGIDTQSLANVWLSAGGTVTSLHNDPWDNWICQVAGNKSIEFYPPYDHDKMFPIIFNRDKGVDVQLHMRPSGELHEWPVGKPDAKIYSAVNPRDPHPNLTADFASAERTSCTVKPGECIWFPRRWWHHVVASEGSWNIGVNLWGKSARESEDSWKAMEKALNTSMSKLRTIASSREQGSGVSSEARNFVSGTEL
jgi:hypothetical protein